MACSRERKGREGERSRGALLGGRDMGRGRAAEGAARSWLVRSCCSFVLLRSIHQREGRKEKRRKRRERKRRERRKKRWEKFVNMEASGKIK
jgi:hypothetical protein